MEALMRRTRMAERQVTRRMKRMKRAQASEAKWDRLRRVKPVGQEVGEQMRRAIMARHEDLELGPLAPRRDIVRPDPNDLQYGTLSASRFRQDFDLTKAQKEDRCAWAGGPQYICLAAGDRVVVTEGAYKNQIGEVEEVKMDSASVVLKSHFKSNMTLPKHLRTEGQAVVPFNSLIPISAVRLVHPIPDPVTGITRDVIVRELKPVNISHDRVSRRASWQRVVPGLNVRIPWPRSAPKKREDCKDDTMRIDVEEKTFVPTLLRPPMPEALVDELRNQYSKFRTRHTDEYIAQKEAEQAAKKARLESASTMLTPLQEFNRLEREKRKARGQPVLSDEMLEKIGQIIAKNKDRIPSRNWTALWAASKTHEVTDGVESVESAVEQLSLESDESKPEPRSPSS